MGQIDSKTAEQIQFWLPICFAAFAVICLIVLYVAARLLIWMISGDKPGFTDTLLMMFLAGGGALSLGCLPFPQSDSDAVNAQAFFAKAFVGLVLGAGAWAYIKFGVKKK